MKKEKTKYGYWNCCGYVGWWSTRKAAEKEAIENGYEKINVDTKIKIEKMRGIK